MYVMPVIKTARDRDALRKAATSGESCYFLGTDSAPHPYARKVNVNGMPGMFNAPVAIETYAKVFEEEGALDKLEAFAADQRRDALQAAGQHRDHHARKDLMGGAGGDQGRRAGRARASCIAAARPSSGRWWVVTASIPGRERKLANPESIHPERCCED